MKQKLRILHLEDLSSDVALVARELKKGKIDPEIKWVDNKNDFKKALVEFLPDVVLCDHSLASFNSVEALQIINESADKIPFILVTATVSEKFAVNVMKQGAFDYILKDRLQRLPVAVQNAMEKKKAEKEKQLFLDDLKYSEERYRKIVETAQEGIWQIDENNRTIFVNKKMCEILEYSEEEMMGRENYFFMDEAGKQIALKELERRKKGIKENIDMQFVTKSGKHIWTNISANPIFDAIGNYKGALGMISDITEKKILVQELLNLKVEEQKHIMKAVVNAQEKERNEIGMELHDNINQLLAASKLFLDHGLSKSNNTPAFLQSKECIIAAMDEVRKLSHILVGPTKNLMIGLVESVEKLSKTISIMNDIKINFIHSAYLEKEGEVELNLVIYRIIQEQFNNILKHSGASEIEIALENKSNRLIVSIKDNGRGFDTRAKRHGIGLKNIKNRTAMYNGIVQILSSPGNGCQMKIMFETNSNERPDASLASCK